MWIPQLASEKPRGEGVGKIKPPLKPFSRGIGTHRVRRSAALRPSVSFAKIGGRLVFVSPGIGTQPFVSFGKTRGVGSYWLKT
jgi:hypothetical protein